MSDHQEALKAFLARCADNYGTVGFTHVDGREFLGRVGEVTDALVFVGWQPSPIYSRTGEEQRWNPEDEWVPLTAIQMNSLIRYDEPSQRWVAFAAEYQLS